MYIKSDFSLLRRLIKGSKLDLEIRENKIKTLTKLTVYCSVNAPLASFSTQRNGSWQAEII